MSAKSFPSGAGRNASWTPFAQPLLLEGVAKRPVLAMGRQGMGRIAAEGGLGAQIIDLTHEPGVRQQL